MRGDEAQEFRYGYFIIVQKRNYAIFENVNKLIAAYQVKDLIGIRELYIGLKAVFNALYIYTVGYLVG